MWEEKEMEETRRRLRELNEFRMLAVAEVGKHIKKVTGEDMLRLELTERRKWRL